MSEFVASIERSKAKSVSFRGHRMTSEQLVINDVSAVLGSTPCCIRNTEILFAAEGDPLSKNFFG